ncbi:MAG: hypothetical protein JXB45_03255 [Candidatus Krumholzibacteriota bacterium]|nr:hypothetical protein [Candidatus Krumholzibacteriota bacterium]
MKRGWRILILSLLTAALLLVGLYYLHYLPDDAYITLRYARNVLRGEGFVYNSGERVEGYTNFLWLILLIASGKLGLPLPLSARVLSLAFSLATLVLAGYAVREYGRDRVDGGWAPSLVLFSAPLLLAASSPFLVWSLAGTEMPLYTFLLCGGFLLLLRRRRPEGVFLVLGLLGLVRPEGLIFYALAGIIVLLESRDRTNLYKWAGILVLLFAPYLIWKWRYFGPLVPNTFYAKTGPAGLMLKNGSAYLLRYASRYGYFLLIGLWLHRKNPFHRNRVILPLVFILTHWISVVALGGDWMPHFRFFLPTLPLLAIFTAAGLSGMIPVRTDSITAPGGGPHGPADISPGKKDPGWRAAVPVITLTLVCLAMVPAGSGYKDFRHERLTVKAYAHLGERLKDILPPDTRLGCGSTGAIGYYSDLFMVDILGLTEPEIARKGKIVSRQPGHLKTLGKHVLSRKPDLLLLGNIQIHTGQRAEDLSRIKIQEQDIIMGQEFTRDYEFINLPLAGNFYLSCYRRRGFFLPL